MNKKSQKVAALLAQLPPLAACDRERKSDPRYRGYFECFNRQLYYEAHDVLEDLWLGTTGPRYCFYKGLIQLAGAFVHLQKSRPDPAGRLFRLCLKNFAACDPVMEGLDVRALAGRIHGWLVRLETSGFDFNLADPGTAPQITLPRHSGQTQGMPKPVS